MKDKKLWFILLAIVFSLIMALAVVEVVNATDANDTEKDWLVAEPEEKICNFSGEDWLWIPGCNPACAYNETLEEQYDNITEEDDYYPWKASDFEDKGNFIHIDYFMNNPRAAVAIIAFVKRSKERAKHVFVFQNVSFGLDAKAEKYYQAILAVHNKTGFNEDEYPPSGLTLAQAKEIFYIDRDEQALFWLSEENNNLTGRLLYYTLLGIYHKRLCSKDAGSAIAVMKDAEGNTSNIKIHRSAYHLATIAYFYGRERVDQCIENCEDLPTEELEKVEMILAIANEPEPTPTPSPTPRRRYDYWQQNPVPL